MKRGEEVVVKQPGAAWANDVRDEDMVVYRVRQHLRVLLKHALNALIRDLRCR
jgi:hypothetical protein